MHELKLAARRPVVHLVSAVLASLAGASCGGSPTLLAQPPDVEDASTTDAGAVDSGAVAASIGAGCGKLLPANQPATIPGKATGYLQYTVTGTGATLDGTMPAKAGPRTFWVRVPADYDPNRKYRVVYIGQGCGGFNTANTATYRLYDEAIGGTEQAIYVALDIPTDMANQDCYDNRDGLKSQEWEAFELIHSTVDANYCVDNDNIMVTGYSTGAWLTNMWGCYFAGDGQHPWNGVPGGGAESSARRFAPRYHIRAQAGTGGGEPDNNPPCNGPIAAMWFHDMTDNNPIAADRAALARVLRMNGCEGSPTKPWHTELASGVCVQYTACPAQYPVVFCETNLCHTANEENFVPAVTHFYAEMAAQ
jgi:poly(3-hydroxybutyrate) depolymerase